MFIAGVFTGCNVTKNLKENQYLLVKNKIEIENPGKLVSEGDLESLIQQDPNKKFLGLIPFKLWWHSIFKKGGESPVILDPGLIEETEKQMRSYLSNIGFYDSRISYDILNKSKKKRKVLYRVKLSEPFRIRNIGFDIKDDSIRNLVFRYNKYSIIDSGSVFNSFLLDSERARIADVLSNNGYFGFTKDFVYYEADSSVANRKVDLTILIRNRDEPGVNKPVAGSGHKIYYLNKVFVYPNYLPFQSDTLPTDTIVAQINDKDDDIRDIYRFVYSSPLKIRPDVITRSMFIEPKTKYSKLDAGQTYKKLNELRIYKYVDINFRESREPPNTHPELNYLDCMVRLTRNPVHSYSIETQLTNSGGDPGIGGNFLYQNKNIFNGAEVLNVRLKVAMEAQNRSVNNENSTENLVFFNTFEAGIEASLYVPKFLAPVNEDIFSKYFRPKTTFNLGYSLQNRIEYDRTITNVSFGYEWSETKFKQHIFYPFDINFVKVNTTPEFDEVLADESQRFQNQYTDHLIFGLRYSYIYSNQEINKIKNVLYFRGNFESAGNLLNLIMNIADKPANSDGYREVIGIRYSQLVKTNFDTRYYFRIDKKRTIALRTFIGIAIPYGNSIDIPFEKGYFGGGANGMRAWPLRYLGPGGFQNTGDKRIERVGDIMLEGNFEYRFPVYRVFTGAVFYDIGNIWLLSENESFPGGEFYFKKFGGQLAMDLGLGIRLDFDYFIFRIDFAQRLKDPGRQPGDRWVIGNVNGWFNPVLNLGIGYPF